MNAPGFFQISSRQSTVRAAAGVSATSASDGSTKPTAPMRPGIFPRGRRNSTDDAVTQPRPPLGSLQYLQPPDSPSTRTWLPPGSDSADLECSAGSGCTAARSAITIAIVPRSAVTQ